MIRRTLFLLALLSVTAGFKPAQATQYAIDPEHGDSSIRFEISRLGLALATGTFREFLGLLSFDAAQPSQTTVDIVIDTASVVSDQPLVGDAIRSKSFLDVRAHPQAAFRSLSVAPLGRDRARLKGEFTLRGITRPLTIDVTRMTPGTATDTITRFSGRGEIKLGDYGIDLNVAKGMGLDLGPINLGIPVGTVDIILTVAGVPVDETVTDRQTAR